MNQRANADGERRLGPAITVPLSLTVTQWAVLLRQLPRDTAQAVRVSLDAHVADLKAQETALVEQIGDLDRRLAENGEEMADVDRQLAEASGG